MNLTTHRLSADPALFNPQLAPRQAQGAWTRDQLSPADWIIPLPEACIAELEAAIQSIDHSVAGQEITNLRPDSCAFTACRQLMSGIQTKLQSQTGLAILDRIPVERYSLAQNKAIYWLLANLLGQVVEQKWDGTLLYDVKDSGKALGHGVRRSITNLGQAFHTDGPWLRRPPETVSLFCLQTAQSGGMSRLTSLLTVHNAMQQRHPDLLKRLYQPFLWDRQTEHDVDDVPYSSQPVYAYDGQMLRARHYHDYVQKGHILAGEPLDEAGQDALDAMQTIMNAPEHWVEFRIETGQIQYINNYQFAHARTAFVDDATATTPRHLIRCWYRDTGTPHIEG